MHDAPETAQPSSTVYLDHAATTPMLPAAVEAMTAHLGDVGTPSSLHASGRRARRRGVARDDRAGAQLPSR
jgi:cysteine sulfinate desulfinase/cysteine desulfurase-like protein